MKAMIINLAVLLIGSNAVLADEVTVPKDPQNFHLFLLVGQSNMAGRGKVEEQDQTTHPRILSLDKTLKWVPAKDPLHFDKPKIVGVGLGKTFASDYVRQNPGVTVGLVPCAVGGSPISSWEPGALDKATKTHPYDDTLPRIKHAMQSGVLKGILWHQGESDSGNDKKAAVYEEKLHALIERIRGELDAKDVPFIAGQMGQFKERPWNDSKKKVDAIHQSLPKKVPRTGFASSDGLSHKGDQVHFDSASYRELGHRYFAAYQQVVAPERPNILFIMADDVGREVLGCYGGETYATPRLDALAASGQRYNHCYSMPVCHPTRMALMTGRYPAVLGNPKWGSFPKEEENRTFASVLKAAGYRTAVAGKWQLSLMKKDLQQPARMGFDQWSLFGWHEGPRYHDPFIYQNGELRDDTKGKYGPDLYVDFLIDFIKQNQSKPFFAYYSMALCHDVTDDIGEPVPYGPNGHWLTYAEMAADMDLQVGRLLDALDTMNLRQKTLVIFTTDNGTAGASYFKYNDGKYERPKVFSKIDGKMVQGGKGKLNDWGTRVPLIVSLPGKVAGGEVREDLVDFSDFLPTLADVADAALPEDVLLNGHSFADAIHSKGSTPRRWAYAEGRNKERFTRTQQYKLYSSGRFFDMAADPEEQSPLKVEGLSESAFEVHKELQAALDSLPAPK